MKKPIMLSREIRITKLPKGRTKAKLFEDLSVGDVITIELNLRQRYSMPRLTIRADWGDTAEGYLNQVANTLDRFEYEEARKTEEEEF